MSEKTLKFDNIRVSKKEFRKYKPIDVDLGNLDQTVVSDKFKHSDDGFQLLVTKKVKLLDHCIILTVAFSYLK